MASITSFPSGNLSERILTIDEFHGIDQSRGVHSVDVGTSPDAVNWISRYGFMRTFHGVHARYADLPADCVRMFQAFIRDANGNDKSYLLASGSGKIYKFNGTTWDTLGTGFAKNEWDFVNYRNAGTDWAIMTNGTDSAQYWTGGASLTALSPTQGSQTISFSQLTLIYERLWGAVHPSNPDRIYWSESFDPTNWEFNTALPDEGGGFVDVATFDGTRIRAIIAAFDDVLIFKDKSIHRLNGTYPGEFNLTQAYGTEGTIASRTIAVAPDRLFFLGSDGLCVYNGMTAQPLSAMGDRKMKGIWNRLNASAIEKACAIIHSNVLYVAVPLDNATDNSHVIEYSLDEGTYSITNCAGISDWMNYRDGQNELLLCLIGKKVCQYDSGTDVLGRVISASWYSPEITMGHLGTKKQTGRLYMSVNAQSIDVTQDPQIKITFTSDGKTREKIITLKAGSNIVRKRIKIRGRTFRFKIENVSGNPLTINRGVQIAYEEDYD